MNKETREAINFLEKLSLETVYMTSGSNESRLAGTKRIKESIKIIKTAIQK